MKKIILIFALGTAMISCENESATEINANQLETACDCKEAILKIQNELNDLEEQAKNQSEALLAKEIEIREKCVGDLSIEKAKDCKALEESLKMAKELDVLLK